MLVFNTVEKGTYFRAYEFARELVKMGHTVTLLATSPEQYFKHTTRLQDGIKVIETPDWYKGSTRSGWDLYNMFYRIAIIKPKDFDIVHVFETRPVNLLPALMMRKAGIPLIFDWADWFGKGGSVEERSNELIKFFLRPIETFFEDRFRRKAFATTVICAKLRERAILLGVNPETITVLPNGFNIMDWPNINKEDARIKLGIDRKDFVIGYVGSLLPKDAKLMAEAFNLVINKIPNARLFHIGQSKYGVIKIVKNPNRIIETGKVNLFEMAVNLAACDICWLPFKDSNANLGRFPMKFSNYLAAGKPIVSTDVGDVGKIIDNFDIGIITGCNAMELSEAVFKLSQNKTLMNNLSKSSLALSRKKEESWTYRTFQIEQIYNGLLRVKR